MRLYDPFEGEYVTVEKALVTGVRKAEDVPFKLVSTGRVAMKPVGRHGNVKDLSDLKVRPRHQGPTKGIERFGKQFQGAPTIAKRGTPMSDVARTGRRGFRLATV